jgi:hypothetical protein
VDGIGFCSVVCGHTSARDNVGFVSPVAGEPPRAGYLETPPGLSMHFRTYRRGSWIMKIIPGLQEHSCMLEEAVVGVHRRGPD